jgi:hypothetical protein
VSGLISTPIRDWSGPNLQSIGKSLALYRFSHLAIMILALTLVGWAQERWIYPPTVIDAEDNAALGEARRFVNRNNWEPALEIYLRLADENPGTSFGAQALESAVFASLMGGDKVGAEAIRLRIISEYPNSKYDIAARYYGVQAQAFNLRDQDKIGAYSDFLADQGAPRMEALLAGQGFEQATQQIRALHPEIRYALSMIYYEGTFLVEDLEQAANLAKFCRGAFGTVPVPNASFTSRLFSILKQWRGKEVGREPSQPDITIVSPTPNSTVGTQHTVSFQLSSGDYRKEQVNLMGLSLKVDGIEQVLNATISGEVDDTLTEGVNFEVLTVSLNPSLAPGTHTIEVDVHAGKGAPSPENSATAVWSFTVFSGGGGKQWWLRRQTRKVVEAEKARRMAEIATSESQQEGAFPPEI